MAQWQELPERAILTTSGHDGLKPGDRITITGQVGVIEHTPTIRTLQHSSISNDNWVITAPKAATLIEEYGSYVQFRRYESLPTYGLGFQYGGTGEMYFQHDLLEKNPLPPFMKGLLDAQRLYNQRNHYKLGKRPMTDEYKIAKGIMSGKITPEDMEITEYCKNKYINVESLGLRGYAESVEAYIRQMVLEDMAKERVDQLLPMDSLKRIED